MDAGMKTMFSYALPDPCDVALIADISAFKKENHTLPDEKMIENIHASLDDPCKRSIDSLRTLSYGSDSLDLVFRKNFVDTTLKVKSVLKGYRLTFEQDSLHKVALIHTNVGVKSELWVEGDEEAE